MADVYRVVVIIECEDEVTGEEEELVDYYVAWAVKDEAAAVRFKDDLVAHGIALMNNEDYGQFDDDEAAEIAQVGDGLT